LRSLDSFLKTLPKILSHVAVAFSAGFSNGNAICAACILTDNPHQIKKGSCERAHGDYAHP
jgi:hypothetical protein